MTVSAGSAAGFTGIGESSAGRNLGREPLDLAAEAIRNAIADAGLERSDIDGAVAFTPDSGSASVMEVIDALGLNVNWFAQCDIGPSQISAVFEALGAVEAGQASHVVAFHASNEGSVRSQYGQGGFLPGSATGVPERVSGHQQWSLPFGAMSVGHMIAGYAQRHMELYGTTREQLAQIALVQRANSALNPAGIYREPLSLDAYLGARMIMEPFCLLDCDVPIDFGTALVVSARSSLSATRRTPIKVMARSASYHSRPSWDQFDDLTTMILRDVGGGLWRRTDYSSSDVDVALLYDGFSFIALTWLEALGFCGRGESGPFVEGGHRISRTGQLPLNPHGGQLSAGRKHGWGLIPEACLQLWGDAGARQIAPAPQVAAVGCGGGIFAGALLLARD